MVKVLIVVYRLTLGMNNLYFYIAIALDFLDFEIHFLEWILMSMKKSLVTINGSIPSMLRTLRIKPIEHID